MSIRERVEEALTKELLAERGMTVYFSHGDPVVRVLVNDTAARTSRSQTWYPADAECYHKARRRATELYELVINKIDFNRLALEVMSAYTSLPGCVDVDDFGSDASRSGAALRAALTTNDTFPDWEAYWRENQVRTYRLGTSRDYLDQKAARGDGS